MTSSNLRVGDIVVVEKGVRVPADLVLLRYKPRWLVPGLEKNPFFKTPTQPDIWKFLFFVFLDFFCGEDFYEFFILPLFFLILPVVTLNRNYKFVVHMSSLHINLNLFCRLLWLYSSQIAKMKLCMYWSCIYHLLCLSRCLSEHLLCYFAMSPNRFFPCFKYTQYKTKNSFIRFDFYRQSNHSISFRTTETSGACFIRTDQLDGETDWKLRLAVPATQRLASDEDLLRVQVGTCIPQTNIQPVQLTFLFSCC